MCVMVPSVCFINKVNDQRFVFFNIPVCLKSPKPVRVVVQLALDSGEVKFSVHSGRILRQGVLIFKTDYFVSNRRIFPYIGPTTLSYLSVASKSVSMHV